MAVERIQPPGLSHPGGTGGAPSYTHVVKAGNTVYIAGQTARNAQGELVGKGDVDAQLVQVFENLETALASVGGGLGNLVKVTIFLTDPRFRQNFREVSSRYLTDNLPASTLLFVAGLAMPEYLVEIEGIAVIE